MRVRRPSGWLRLNFPQRRFGSTTAGFVVGRAVLDAGSKRVAMHYVLKVEIGGVAGALLRSSEKKPPDVHVWILDGEAPAFVKSEGPLYYGGPN